MGQRNRFCGSERVLEEKEYEVVGGESFQNSNSQRSSFKQWKGPRSARAKGIGNVEARGVLVGGQAVRWLISTTCHEVT